ncbi:MAG: transposase, partial [Phycisphaerales bacterium]
MSPAKALAPHPQFRTWLSSGERLKENPILHQKVEHMLTRPVGRPPKKPIVRYHSFRYQAASWKIARRVVAKVEWHAGELFPRVG